MIKIEMKILKYETFLIMGLLMFIFSIIIYTSTEKSLLIPNIFFEIVVPGVCCILFSFLLNIENDPPLELLLCTKYSVMKIILHRFLVLMSEIVITSFVYMVILKYLYIDFNLGELMLCSIVSVFFLSVFSVTLSIVFNSSITGSAFGILYWIFFLLTGDRLGNNILFQYLNPFGYLRGYSANILICNKIVLLVTSFILLLVIYRISRKREHFIK